MKTFVAIPCMDMVNTSFVRSLIGMRLTEGDSFNYCFSQASLVYDSRNKLANMAIEGGYDRVLWLDSDMVFQADLLERLGADLDEGRDLVSGLYFTRKPPIRPAVYQRLGMYPRPVDGATVPTAEPVAELPEEIFEAEGIGFGAVLMSVKLLKDVADRFGLPFSPILGFGEDFSFCLRARELGAHLWCDPRVVLQHEGMHLFGVEEYLISKGG